VPFPGDLMDYRKMVTKKLGYWSPHNFQLSMCLNFISVYSIPIPLIARFGLFRILFHFHRMT
jgi:hypothetical protein